MSKNLKYLISCVILALSVCVAQIVGLSVLTLGVLAAFLIVLGWSCLHGFTFPVLLFFLPWSSLLRLSPDNISFYTVGLVLVCAISVVRSGFLIKKTYAFLGLSLLVITLLSRLISGSGLTLSYLCFMMMIFLMPSVQQEYTEKKYDFRSATIFFAVGIVLAALCAQRFVSYNNIKQFIDVDSYLTITRWCGFYSDPNFYTAQITAAIGGTLLLILHSNRRQILPLSVLCVLLIYCGLLSGSKSFLLVFICVFLIWLVLLFRMRGKSGIKLLIYGVLMLTTVFIASSAVFQDLLSIILTRFALGDQTLNGFTTGRTEIWKNYLNEVFHNMKVFLVGHGLENVLVEGRASHNTLIQIVFQVGMLGIPFLMAWCWNFLQLPMLKNVKKKSNILLLSVGTLLPWLAIDMLFFDDFFMIQWFLLMGAHFVMNYEAENTAEEIGAGQAMMNEVC